MLIKNILAREILNSSATTSLEATVTLQDNTQGTASVPFGASAGKHEAFVLFDQDSNRFKGKGMLKAVNYINTEIKNALVGQDAYNQKEIDKIMIGLDGTENKARLGGNAILGVSLAVARASAKSQKLELYQYINKMLSAEYNISTTELPKPMMVVIEGGKHAENSTDFQEYLIVPQTSKSAKENIRTGAEVYLSLKQILKERKYNTNIGNEGAYAPTGIKNNTEPWELIAKAVEKAGYKLGKDVMFASDPACSELVGKDGRYYLKHEGLDLSPQDMINYFDKWVAKYPFISLEDILAEDSWGDWAKAQEQLGGKIRLIGDDFLVTNPKRLKKAIEQKACNSILIKLNQIGTLSETINTIEMAHKAGFWTVVSHRGGGETNDTAMIDLAVGCGCKMVKCGVARGERVCKYNRLMEIERELVGA